MIKSSFSLIAASMLLCMPTAAYAKWLRADTDKFIIYSEGSEKSLRDFAGTLQRFDATLRMLFKIPVEDETTRLTIYLVPNAGDAGRLASGKGGSSIGGFYLPADEGSFAVSHRDRTVIKGTSQAQQVLFHEYSHHFMRRHFRGAFPSWLTEGFAEFYSTTDFTEAGQAETGKIPYGRAYGLIMMPKIPVETLLFERPGTQRTAAQRDVYYGRAWLLTHMLHFETSRAEQLNAYVAAINNGVDPKKAATDAFGDLARLDKDLNRYMEQRLSYWTLKPTIPLPANLTVTALPAAEDALLPLRLERLSARRERTRLTKVCEGLQELAAEYPGDANVWYELAQAEWDAADETADRFVVRSAIDKALAIEPKHVRANVLLGLFLAKEAQDGSDASAEDWNAVRKPIILANRTAPDDPVPLYAYFNSFIDQGIEPPKIAIDGLTRAFILAPENTQRRVSYAFALAKGGDVDGAIRIAKVVAYDPHDNGEGERLLGQLEAVRKVPETAKGNREIELKPEGKPRSETQ